MSTAQSAVDHSDSPSFGFCGGRLSRRANWSGINIAAMVISFIIFWPLGLFVLYWILTGREARDLPAAARDKWDSLVAGSQKGGAGDNVVFNEYQQTQYDRIREIKEEIRERAPRFAQFRDGAKRRADQEEFDQFMATNPVEVNK